MGCCFSCFNSGEKNSLTGEPNERTTLLGNPVSNSIGRPLFNQDFTEATGGQLGDEQAALNKILHQTVVDIIDVSAIPTLIEQKDYLDRVKQYHRRVGSLQLRLKSKEKMLLKDVPNIEGALSESPLLMADIRMVEDAHKDVFVALKGIQIEHHGDLVTKFGLS